MSSLKMSYCYLAFRTNVLLNLYCPGHLSYFSPNESEPLQVVSFLFPSRFSEGVSNPLHAISRGSSAGCCLVHIRCEGHQQAKKNDHVWQIHTGYIPQVRTECLQIMNLFLINFWLLHVQATCLSQGCNYFNNLTCCHAEIETADKTCYLTLSQQPDTGPASTSTDSFTKIVYQGSHQSTIV